MNTNNLKMQLQEDEYVFPYHYLNLNVDYYKYLRDIENLNRFQIIKNMLKPYNNQLILDLGCGDGRFCYEIKNEKIKIIGVDYSERAIKFARIFNPEISFFIQDTDHLDLPQKFDYVLLIEILEHIVPERIPQALQNISKVLKKNGKLIITVPSTNLEIIEKHFQHFNNESLEKTLHPYFEINKITGFSLTGLKRRIFLFLRGIGFFVYPLRNRIKLIKKYYSYLNNYFRAKLATGDPDKSLGLIAVCKKVD